MRGVRQRVHLRSNTERLLVLGDQAERRDESAAAFSIFWLYMSAVFGEHGPRYKGTRRENATVGVVDSKWFKSEDKRSNGEKEE